jgi:hypothetical protein
LSVCKCQLTCTPCLQWRNRSCRCFLIFIFCR